jgi:cytochrome c-type biogenesis protein
VLPLVPGSALRAHRDTLDKLAAGVIVALGLYFVLTAFVARLNREWHVERLIASAGKGGPVVAGAAFAVAWTQCVGPTLGAIVSAAALTDSVGHAAVLLAFYSAGLAIPFLATALAFSRMTSAFAVVKRRFPVISALGGAILIAMGGPDLDGRALPAQPQGAAAPRRPRHQLLQLGLSALTRGRIPDS